MVAKAVLWATIDNFSSRLRGAFLEPYILCVLGGGWEVGDAAYPHRDYGRGLC